MVDYLSILRDELQRAHAAASEARKQGYDPVDEVEVKIAKDVAARVEGIVGPPGIAEVIRTLESSGMPREDLAFEVAKKIAAGDIIKADKEKLIEQAVRTGLGILTEGVLVAPTEGISKVKINTNPDGSNYVAVYYAGPIRSAGGTAAALSLVLADIARRICGIGDYRATDSQIMRYIEEVTTYETRCVHLQYLPPEEDIRVIAGNCPICINGDPTEKIEVSAYRGVPGVETDRVRGGVPLVMCEGVAAKAAKLFKYTKRLKLNWDWLEKIIKIKKKQDKIEIKPDWSYMEGLVAGRPVFSHPSAKGGFRLRYGRSKSNGLMGKNVHPATMIILSNFLAYGTHMKIERPGKGCIIVAHDGIEPPVVKLKNGRVMKVRTIEEAYAYDKEIEEILFLGDILCTFGDFVKSNHPLMASGYCEEWWQKEVEAKGAQLLENLDVQSLFKFSKIHNVPLHPKFTFTWHDISPEQITVLVQWLKKSRLEMENNIPKSLVIDGIDGKRVLEELLVEHRLHDDKVLIDGEDGYALLASLGAITEDNKIDFTTFDKKWNNTKPVLELVNELSGIKIKAKAPTYIGARMGRPEKAKERKMDGSPHVLFPTGSFKNRSLSKQYRLLKSREGEKTINLEIVRLRCQKCKKLGIYRKCDVCGNIAKEERICQQCGRVVETEIHCDRNTIPYDRRPIDLIEIFETVKSDVGNTTEDVRGVKVLSNGSKIPERLEKGFIRAKHDVYVFRDGTSRFDATDVPLTHFTPKEVGLSVEKAIALGYEKDYLGNKLEHDYQTVGLLHQDIMLATAGAEYFIRVANFIDDMLVNLYGLKPFYNVKTRDDLVGHMAVGLSPHTSAGVLCRIIGFTKANVGYGHPYFHTAKRRNADGDEDCVMLLMDALINFSRKYLSGNRGGTMDAPLVLSMEINPTEVDDEAHCIEFVSHYPLEFYEAAEKNALPGDVKLKTVKDVLGSPEQYELPITHPGGTLDAGNIRTAYVELESIPEKIDIQFRLQEKLRSVDHRDAAERLILSHFIPDLYGNLRSFSRQTFRCVSCNTIFRRVPLAGKCSKCGGNLLLTINKGGIEKYLQISRDIVNKYDLPDYLKQRLELVEREIRSIFEDDKIKQMGLSDFL
ncbi:MAG: DNA polymerase II large subunit [Candidatus Micrarchaeota archaeon]